MHKNIAKEKKRRKKEITKGQKKKNRNIVMKKVAKIVKNMKRREIISQNEQRSQIENNFWTQGLPKQTEIPYKVANSKLDPFAPTFPGGADEASGMCQLLGAKLKFTPSPERSMGIDGERNVIKTEEYVKLGI